jgi:hypothetical protein
MQRKRLTKKEREERWMSMCISIVLPSGILDLKLKNRSWRRSVREGQISVSFSFLYPDNLVIETKTNAKLTPY